MGRSTVGTVLDLKIAKSTFSPPSELICHPCAPMATTPYPQDPCPSQPIALLSTCYPFVGEWLGVDPLLTRRLGIPTIPYAFTLASYLCLSSPTLPNSLGPLFSLFCFF